MRTTMYTAERTRCIWMEVGLLAYLFCDRCYDCDTCPIDAAMRSHYAADRPVVPTAAASSKEHRLADEVGDLRPVRGNVV
jgi:hypothetical protein